MFIGTSMAGSGLVVSVLVFGAKFLGLDLDEGTITEGVANILAAVGFVLLVWGQLRRKDLNWGLFRK